MGLFIIRKNRIICVPERVLVITAYLLGIFVGLIAKRVIRKLKEKQEKQNMRFPNAGGSQLDLELYNQNEIGYIILSCVSHHEQFLVRDPKLNEIETH